MTAHFFDTSALVKRYSIAPNEPGSDYVSLLMESSEAVVVSDITRVEVIAALARQGNASAKAKRRAERAIERFELEHRALCLVVERDDATLEQATALARTGQLKGCDAVQLASALKVRTAMKRLSGDTFIFVAADTSLVQAARSQGLTTDNPEEHAAAKRQSSGD